MFKIICHSGERIQNVTDSHAGFTRYLWTEAVSGKKKLRIQKYSNTCGRDLSRSDQKNIFLECKINIHLARKYQLTIFTSPTAYGTAILRGHPSHEKIVGPYARQRQYLHLPLNPTSLSLSAIKHSTD